MMICSRTLLWFSALLPLAMGTDAIANELSHVSAPTPGVGVIDPSFRSGDNCGGALRGHDLSFENAYGWVFGGVQAPDFGAFAEGFEGNYQLCEITLFLTEFGNQSGQTLDLFVWDDDGTGNPGAVLELAADIDPGPVLTWPSISPVRIPVSTQVDGNWWVGFWGNWPGEPAGFLLAADEDGSGGNPRTKIAPGLGYPAGWTNPNAVESWSEARSLGIQVSYEGGASVDDLFGEGDGIADGFGRTEPTSRVSSIAPNPFRGSTEIEFRNDSEEAVSLHVFDVDGRRIRTLVDGLPGPGTHRVSWDGTADDGRALAAGVYFLRPDGASAGGGERIVLVR